MNIKRIIIPLLLIILLASTIAFGSNIPLGPYFDDTYFDLSDSALILKVVPHEKGGLEADVSAYDGLIKITGGATSNLTIGIGDDNIVEIDDADAAVDDYCKLTANGIIGRSYSEVKTDLSLNYVENLKVKLDGTQAPTVNNDTDEGYAVGSRWFDVTNDKEYVCLDNTDGVAVWTETTQSGGGGAFTDLTDTPANYTGSSLKHVRVNVGETALEFVTLGGGGDMLKATYDTDEDGDIDVAAGGTEKSSWTQYAIPYLSATTTFGEIPIGTAEYALTVAAGATGYDWTLFDLSLYYLKTEIDTQGELETIWGDTLMNDLVDDPDPDLGGQLQSGAHSINFTEQVLTSGTAIAWNLGNSNKATLTAAHNFTITITAPSGALNAQLIITQDGTGSRVMDEIVTQTDTAIATTDVHADTEIIDLVIDIPTSARIRFKTSATDLPDPLVVDTVYWAIRTSENHIKVSTTKANAIAGTAIDITDQGSGTHTVQQLVKWTSGSLGVLSTAAGSEDILSLTYKTGDKQWYAQLAKDFQ